LVLLAGGPPAAGEDAGPGTLFVPATDCMACHNNLVDAAGRDLSIGTDWRSTMMANSARDPYWQAAVRRETLDHPKAVAAIEDECSVCHMPMARYTAHAGGGQGRIFTHLPHSPQPASLTPLARDGVSCTMCHQIAADKLGQRASFVGRFVVDTEKTLGERVVFGPYDVDAGRTRIMSSASRFVQKKAAHIRDSALCGSCHTLYTHALGPDGEAIGELPEQMPYLEWLHSSYPEDKSCQSCHMVAAAGQVHIASVWGQPRAGFRQHVFRGANFFIPRLLNRYRRELVPDALPQELEATADRTAAHLKSSSARLELADARIAGDRLEVTARLHNLAGHKLPSAYPSRRAWIHLTVRDGAGQVVFESGALRPDGSIAGNDNDADGARFEPHYAAIDSGEQVQIYEPILGGPDGAVTTGLLTATQYLKDNRLLPTGFDKTTADDDIAVVGGAFDDADFTGGGDAVDYRVPLGGCSGPLSVSAELLFQPIGYRWAHNLEGYQALEPRRFVAYYEAAAAESALVLATAELQVAPAPPQPPPEPPPPPAAAGDAEGASGGAS
jgi:hypothetical protein